MFTFSLTRARPRVGFHKALLPSNFRSALRKDYLRRHRQYGPQIDGASGSRSSINRKFKPKPRT
jgi:hypothetical protein